MERKAFIIRIPTELHHQLKEAVAYKDISANKLINDLLEKEVKKIIQKRDSEIKNQEE